ncbi:MAG: hypothetical protein QOI51_2361 [Nocardioidaceae bacterium]|nr:hypothetical protein [Nocardioidaceae bacterium]
MVPVIPVKRPRTAVREEAGMVTAEAAAVLRLVAIFTLAMVWLLSVGITQVRVVDAARDAARAVARGDPDDQAIVAARRTAGADARVGIHRAAGLVTVTVLEQARAPGWLLVPLPAVAIRSQSTVEVEDAPTGR